MRWEWYLKNFKETQQAHERTNTITSKRYITMSLKSLVSFIDEISQIIIIIFLLLFKGMCTLMTQYMNL